MPSSGCQKCARSEEHTSELQSHDNLVCRLLLEKKEPSERGFGGLGRGVRGVVGGRGGACADRCGGMGGVGGALAWAPGSPASGCFFFLMARAPPKTPPFPHPRPSAF